MEDINSCPMIVVDEVTLELRHLSNLCFVMAQLRDRTDAIDAEAVGDAMRVIWDFLDRQIKVLDSIDWFAEKAVGA